MNKKRGFLISIFFIIVLFVAIFLPKEMGSLDKRLFQVVKGEGSRDIAHNLEQNGIIRFGPFFRLYVLTTGISGKLQAGEYELSPGMSMFQIARKFARGDVVKEEFTIIEGWNLLDIAQYLEQKGMFQAEEFLEITGFPAVDHRKAPDFPTPYDFSKEYAFLKEKPAYISLEGYLFPDTYFVQKGAGMKEVIRLMLDNFKKKTAEASFKDSAVFDIVIIASLLEKEVRTPKDKRIVAGILKTRLEHGIPLQVDATVTYATGRNNGKVSLRDTKTDSLFNTYKYPGLPLGPISNPGLKSIQAALNPESNPYLYYLSTPEGETIFSKTLEEHNKAKARYLK